MAVAAGFSLILTFLTTRWVEVYAWQYGLLLFAGLFAVVANADYFVTFLRGHIKAAGSAFSHLGFGVMIVGILASGLNKHYISSNPWAMEGLIEGATEESVRNNIVLFQGEPMIMGNYEVTFVRDTMADFTRTYTVHYKRRNAAGKVVEEFDLHPNILYDKSFTKIAASNPSTKRYWTRDIFTHIASLPQVEMDFEYRKQREDSLNYRQVEALLNQTVVFSDTVPVRDRDTFVVRPYRLRVESLTRRPVHPDYKPEADDLAFGARIAVTREGDDTTYFVEPVIALRGQFLYQYPAQINDLSAKVRLNEGLFGQYLLPEEALNYQEFRMKQGETITFEGLQVQFAGFNREVRHPNYTPEEGDIAVSGVFNVLGPDGQTYQAEPVYLIRGNRPFNIKEEVEEAGLHLRFVSLDPATESIELLLAHTDVSQRTIPIDVATDSLRSDYIVLEAIVFPGINLFWLGSVLMMAGLGLGMWNRLRRKTGEKTSIE